MMDGGWWMVEGGRVGVGEYFLDAHDDGVE